MIMNHYVMHYVFLALRFLKTLVGWSETKIKHVCRFDRVLQ